MLDDAAFVGQCRHLLLLGDPEQLRFIRPKACELCRFFAECCRRRSAVICVYMYWVCRGLTELANSGQAIQGVKALSEAVQKLRGSPECLTSVHSDYLQLCLVAKNFKVACFLGTDTGFQKPCFNLFVFSLQSRYWISGS